MPNEPFYDFIFFETLPNIGKGGNGNQTESMTFFKENRTGTR